MLVLAFVWLALFVYELVWGLNRLLEMAGYAIWGLFVGRDAENDEAELAGAKQLAALREEVIALRDEMRALARRPQ